MSSAETAGPNCTLAAAADPICFQLHRLTPALPPHCLHPAAAVVRCLLGCWLCSGAALELLVLLLVLQVAQLCTRLPLIVLTRGHTSHQ